MSQTLMLPKNDLMEIQERRNTRLLLIMLPIVLVLGIISLVVQDAIRNFDHGIFDDPDTIALMASLALIFGAYLAARARRVQLAAGLFVAITFIVTTATPFMPGAQIGLMASMILPVLIAAFFFRLRIVISVIAAQLVIVVALILGRGSELKLGRSDYFLLYNMLVIGEALIVAFVNHLRSIEQERRAELQSLNSELESLNQGLERRVDERTRELKAAKEVADRAREEAEKANAVKSQFLASMSHELRTPLNAIINLTKLLNKGLMGPVTGEQNETLVKVIDSATHLLDLINDVLDISKIEAGALQLFVQDDIDVAKELASTVQTARVLLQDKPVEVRLHLQEGLPVIRGDRQRIRQILLNLASNACKFTDAGSVTLGARQQGDELLITVEDTGPGIATEDQGTIFETFRQTEVGLRKGKGTGLGLPISRRLAEAHHGRLWVSSAPGKGTTFSVALPVRSERLALTLPQEVTA